MSLQKRETSNYAVVQRIARRKAYSRELQRVARPAVKSAELHAELAVAARTQIGDFAFAPAGLPENRAGSQLGLLRTLLALGRFAPYHKSTLDHEHGCVERMRSRS